MTTVISEMAQSLVSAIASLGQGIATGIGSTLQALFIETTGTGENAVSHLSTTGSIIVAFGAIALGLGIARLCVGFIFGLGKGRL